MRLKGGGPSEEEKVEEVQLVAAEEVRSPAPKRTQYGLQKFFGTPEQKASAQPVLAEQVVPYQRKPKSRTQLEAEAAREHYLDLVAAEEAEQGDEAHALEVAKRRKLSQGARFTKLAAPKRKTQAGPKLELTANKKLSIVKMLQESKPEFADLASYWKAMEQRTGLSRRQLKHFLGTAKKLQETAELPLKKFNTKNRRRKRLSGAGRKVPFPEEVAQLKQWLEVERACGHTVGKSDLLREFCTILRATAQHLRDEAKNALLSPLQKAEKILAAKTREERAEAVSAKRTYAKSFTERLVKWIGAKFITAEVVSNISELEAEVRCKLTWQEFDSCLWLCSLSTESELAEAGVVADPKEFVAQRKHLVVGFSDQVPLWAKAPGREALFAETEVHPSAAVKDFSEVRAAIEDVMHLQGAPQMLVEPLPSPSSGFKTPQKAKSNESLQEDSVKRALSFGSTPDKQQALQLALENPDLEEPKPEECKDQGTKVEEPQPKQPKPLEPKPEEPKPLQPKPEEPKLEELKHEESKRRLTGNQAAASAPARSLPKPGSLTILGHSGEERFRITYEARQLLSNPIRLC